MFLLILSLSQIFLKNYRKYVFFLGSSWFKLIFVCVLFLSPVSGFSTQNYYDILGVSTTATPEQIKKAYRSLSKRFHPDITHPETKHLSVEEKTRKLQEINKAYDVLRDSEKRTEYDYSFSNPSQAQGQSDFTGKDNPFSQNFKDIFKSEVDGLEIKRLKPYERKAVELFYNFSFFKKPPQVFHREEERIRQLLRKEQARESLSSQEKAELSQYKKQERADLKNFRRIMLQLGLPSSSYHAVLLHNYLRGLKSEWVGQNKPEGQLLLEASPGKSSGYRPNFNEQRIYRSLENIKIAFDSTTYENLKTMSQPINAKFLKSFPIQFLVFSLAMGSSIYSHSIYNSEVVGAEKNPGELMTTMTQTLSPSGIISFFVFVAMSQQVHYRLYGLGRFMDGKSLAGWNLNGATARALAPPLGLGTGFFISTVITELWHDPELGPCIGEMFKKEETVQQVGIFEYASACDRFHLNWVAQEKWKSYAVDIASLIGSSIISHKIINTLIDFIGRTSLPGRFYALAFRTGINFVPYVGFLRFFANMFAFLEVHKLLESWVGHSLKEQFRAGGTKNAMSDFSSFLFYFSDSIQNKTLPTEVLSWSRDKLEACFEDERLCEGHKANQFQSISEFGFQFKKIKRHIQEIGARFKFWQELSHQSHNQSYYLWSHKLNQKLIDYELSSQLLKNIFIQSQFEYNKGLVVETTHWDSFEDVNSDTIEHWNRRNQLYFHRGFLSENFDSYCELFNKLKAENSIELKALSSSCEEKLIPEDQTYTNFLMLETAQLINIQLGKIKLNKTYEDMHVKDYISFKENHLFSSNPAFSIKNLEYNHLENGMKSISYEKKFALAKKLISASVDFENILSHLDPSEAFQLKKKVTENVLPGYQTDKCQSKYFNYFLSPERYSEEINQECLSLSQGRNECSYLFSEAKPEKDICVASFKHLASNEVKKEAFLKFLTAGMYILQGIIKDAQSRKTIFTPYMSGVVSQDSLFSLVDPVTLDIAGLFEVYKKGEGPFVVFNESQKDLKKVKGFKGLMDKSLIPDVFSDKTIGNYYFILKRLVCESPNKKDSFSVPHFFNLDSLQLFNFNTNQFESMNSVCGSAWSEKTAHDTLFNKPVKYKGQTYENMYLVLEGILKNRYSSTKGLVQDYYRHSENQLTKMRHSLKEDLDILTDGFYKKMINANSPVTYNSSFEDLLAYYDQDKVSFSWCSVAKDMSFGLSENLVECLEGFKYLEISVFQLNYWTHRLEQLLSMGDQIETCDEEGCQTLNEKFIYQKRINENGELEIVRKFSKEDFNKMHHALLSLLQFYNDSYRDGKSLSEINPKEFIESRASFDNQIPSGLLSSSQINGLKNHEKYLFDFIMEQAGHSIRHDTLTWLMSSNQGLGSSVWEELVYSVVVEIYKGVQLFYNQLLPLEITNELDKKIQLFEINKVQQ